MALDIFDILTAFTRSAFDEDLNIKMLAKNITLYRMMTEQNAVVETGKKIQVAVQIGEHQGRSVKSGTEPYPAEILQVFEEFDIDWCRYINGMAIDGFTYRLNTGMELEDAIGAGAGVLSDGSAKTLINIHKNELMGLVGTCQRQISKMMYGDGTANKGADLLGLGLIMDSQRPYGGRSTTEFGYHDWKQALQGALNPQENGKPARHSPFEKDLAGAALEVYGDLEHVLIDLNRRGSKYTEGQEHLPDMDHWLFMSPPTYAAVMNVLRDDLRRPTTGTGGDPEIGGFQSGMYWEEYYAKLFPDADCPDDHIYGFNRNCLKYCQMDTDKKFMKKWRLSDTQDSIIVPFFKDHQLRCDDRSQTFRLRGFNEVTA